MPFATCRGCGRFFVVAQRPSPLGPCAMCAQRLHRVTRGEALTHLHQPGECPTFVFSPLALPEGRALDSQPMAVEETRQARRAVKARQRRRAAPQIQ